MPIQSIGPIPIGAGRRGPIAGKLQKAFFAVIDGSRPDTRGWLLPVHFRDGAVSKEAVLIIKG